MNKHVLLGIALLGGHTFAADTTLAAAALVNPDYSVQREKAAERMNTAATTRLAPVYPAMAAWVVDRYRLAEAAGIGIDLGGGPGDLIVELAERTPAMTWINADINTYSFPYLFRKADAAGTAHRIGAIFADAHALPFKDNIAAIIVSRGTFQFWSDKSAAFREIARVLKPGGAALIGRGFTPNLNPATAAGIRKAQGDGGPAYDVEATKKELEQFMKAAGIEHYTILVPQREDAPDVKYGIWLEIRKAKP